MKLRIKKDPYGVDGYICRSMEERCGIVGWIKATGDTMEAAYKNWEERATYFRKESQEAVQRFNNLVQHDQWVTDADLRISKLVAFWRSLLNSIKGKRP